MLKDACVNAACILVQSATVAVKPHDLSNTEALQSVAMDIFEVGDVERDASNRCDVYNESFVLVPCVMF